MVAGSVDGQMAGARRRLVETLRERGIRDLAVLRAFDLTPRHLFVPTGVRHRAYEDAPLRYLELLELKGQERVLEIGTGSGYQTVLLSHLVAQVFTIERIPALYNIGRENIARAGAKNVSMLLGDGTVGWREYSPYNAILVSAGGPSIPQPLIEQLADGGRMIVPVGGLDEQVLKLVVRHGADVRITDVAPVRFVPLFGTHGWEQQT
jgi:protein-L-isoaspartate(D-aspartate) O-methyltransferase